MHISRPSESGLKEANWGLRASFTLVRALFTWASPQPWRHSWRCFSHVLITPYPKIAGRVNLSPQDSRASCKVHAVETDPEFKAWGDFATCLHSRPPTSYWTIATSRSVLRANEVLSNLRHFCRRIVRVSPPTTMATDLLLQVTCALFSNSS
jgi:hypothetical protein